MVTDTIIAVLVCAFLSGGCLYMALDSAKKGEHPALTAAIGVNAFIWLFFGTIILIAHIEWVSG